MLSTIAGMTGRCHHTQIFSTEMEFCRHFCQAWPGSVILLILSSHIACDDRCVPLCPAIGWDRVSQMFCLC
jgi:hypothetical protein